MQLDLLRTFVVFAQSRNIYEASSKLGVSQPTISIQLKALEKSFKRELFSTKGKKKILNPYGKALFDSLAPLLGQLEQNIDLVQKKFDSLENITIKIAGGQEELSKVAERIVFPGKVEFLAMSNSESVQRLLDADIDYVVSYLLPDHGDILFKRIETSTFHFLAHKKLFGKGEVTIERFKDLSFLENNSLLTYSKELPYISDWCSVHEIDKRILNTKYTLSNWGSIVKMIEEEKGYTLCPSHFISKNKNVIALPINNKILKPFNFYLLYKNEIKNIFPMDKIFDF